MKPILNIAILSIFIFLSCKKNGDLQNVNKKIDFNDALQETNNVAPPANYSTIHTYRTEARKFVASALAKAMTNNQVRNFIKSQTTNKLLNETEFLYAEHYNVVIHSGKTLATILRENSNKSDTFFNHDLLYYDPYMSILIPDDYEPENWDINSVTPKVAAAPSGWDDDIEVFLPIYDDLGTSNLQSSNLQPENLTAVITECESLTAFPKNYIGNSGNPFFSNNYYNYFVNENCNVNDGEEFILNTNDQQNQPKGKNISKRSCDRDNNTSKLDVLGNINVNGKSSLGAIEGWAKGKPEIIYHVVYNVGTPTNPNWIDVLKILPRISRKQAKNATSLTLNITHMLWGSPLVMDRYFLRFGEREGNGGAPDPRNTTLNVSVNNVNITISQSINWRRRDREIGEQDVQFCTAANGNGTIFNSSNVTFNIKI
jgi:hypothetical protein